MSNTPGNPAASMCRVSSNGEAVGAWFSSAVLLGAMLGIGCWPAASTAPSPPKKESRAANVNAPGEWGKEVGGLRARIWTDKERFNLTEPIPVHYAIQNASQEPKTVWHSGFWPNHRIDVTGPDNQPAKFASGGEARWKAFTPGGAREKNAPLVLQPGATDDAYEAYNLRDIFDMKTPGAYIVQYLYQETKQDAVKSNRLKVVVDKTTKRIR